MSNAYKYTAVGASVLVMVFASALAAANRGDPGPVERGSGVVADQQVVSSPVVEPAVTPDVPETAEPSVESAAPNYHLNWWSVNNGGPTRVSGSNYGLGMTVHQPAAGYVSGSNFNMGFGFWYGAVDYCPMTLFGDVDGGGTISPADIIYLVNLIFRLGPDPIPCLAAGDVDCSGGMSSADIITLVNSIFKAGAPPCNTCTSPLAAGC